MLGEKIQQLRKANGMSQEELAGNLTVSRQAISKWELGESMPDTENILQLSKLFGVSTDFLLNDDYESDKDIPAVQISNDNLKTEYRSKVRKASYWLTGVGLFGVLTLWILSSVIPAVKLLPSTNRGSIEFYSPKEVSGDFGAFLSTYHLSTLFILCCVLILLGIAFLLYSHAVYKKLKHNK